MAYFAPGTTTWRSRLKYCNFLLYCTINEKLSDIYSDVVYGVITKGTSVQLNTLLPLTIECAIGPIVGGALQMQLLACYCYRQPRKSWLRFALSGHGSDYAWLSCVCMCSVDFDGSITNERTFNEIWNAFYQQSRRRVERNKNSSGDEIANVNFLTTISHTRRPTSKYRKRDKPTSFNKLDDR